MGVYLHWKKKSGGEITLWFDVVTNEEHSYTSEVTEHPVEEGADVTDNISPGLPTIKVDAFISNTPIYTKSDWAVTQQASGKLVGAYAGAPTAMPLDVPFYEPPLAPTPGAVLNALSSAVGSLFGDKKQYSAEVLQFSEPFNAVQDLYDELKGVHENADLVEVVTSTGTLEKMAMTSFQFTRDVGVGDAGKFSLEFKQIRTVSVQNNVAIPKLASGFAKVDKGKKGPAAAGPTSSALFKGGAAIASWAGL